MGAEADRRLLVIGAQCPPHGALSFLPDVAERLYAVMTRPDVGACRSALGDRPGLLLDPTGREAEDAFRTALREAGAAQARLFVSLIGHGFFDGDAFYFLLPDSWDDDGLDPSRALKPVEIAGEEQRNRASGLDGLLMLVDACYSGAAAVNGSERLAQVRFAGWRFEILTAGDDREVAGACFSKALIDLLSTGMPGVTEATLRCASLRPRLIERCAAQRPTHNTFNADDALFLGYNIALRAADAPWAGTAAAGDVDRLSAGFRPVPALGEVRDAVEAHPEGVAIVAPTGAGKSTLIAAMARPDVTADMIPPRYLAAVAFVTGATTSEELAVLIADQLERSVEGFAEARPVVRRLLASEPEVWGRLGPFDRELLTPLDGLPATEPIRIAVDGLERATPAAGDLRGSLARLGAMPTVRLIVTASPEAALPEGLHVLRLGPAGDHEIAAYLAGSGVPAADAERLAARAEGNWLRARQLAADPAAPVSDLDPGFAAALERTLADGGVAWEELGPVLTVLTAAGANAVLPIDLLVAASAHLGGPGTRPRVRDVLVAAGDLVARSQAGTPDERAGLFHPAVGEHLAHAGGDRGVDPARGHEAVLAAIHALAPRQDPASEDAVQAYATATEAEHLWALGRHAEATQARRDRRFALPRENLEAWRRWERRARETLGPDDPVALAAAHGVAAWTGHAGEPGRALELLDDLEPRMTRCLGPDDRETLGVRGTRALNVDRIGDPRRAREIAEALAADRERVLGAGDPDTLRGRMELAGIAGDAGDPLAARDMLRRALDDAGAMPDPDDPEALRLRSLLAIATGNAGDPREAERMARELLPRFEATFGSRSPSTLAARASVAYWTASAGDPARSVAMLEELLPAYEESLGPDHPETLGAGASHALAVAGAGHAAEALRLLAALLPRYEALLGADHPLTLGARINIAALTGQAGDARRALQLFADVLPAQERALGSEHPAVLTARGNAAFWTMAAGDAAAAGRTVAELLPVCARVLGPDHPDVLRIEGIGAQAAGGAGRPAEALAVFTGLRERYTRVLGPDHPDTLGARANIALWRGNAGDPAGARRELAEILPVYEAALGAENPGTLAVRSSLATWTGTAGDPAGALRAFTELLPTLERVLGPEHPDVLAARANIAVWTGYAGDAPGAVRLLTALVPVYERVLGPGHPETLRLRGFVALGTGSAGDPAGALQRFQDLVPLLERALGPSHVDVLNARANLATWTGAAGDPVTARTLLAELVPDFTRILGPEHPATLGARASAALWTGNAGDPVAARRMLEDLVPELARILGPDHPDTLGARFGVAQWAYASGDLAGARRAFTDLVPDLERALGPDHPNVRAARMGAGLPPPAPPGLLGGIGRLLGRRTGGGSGPGWGP